MGMGRRISRPRLFVYAVLLLPPLAALGLRSLSRSDLSPPRAVLAEGTDERSPFLETPPPEGTPREGGLREASEATEPPPPIQLRKMPSPEASVILNEVHYHPAGDDP